MNKKKKLISSFAWYYGISSIVICIAACIATIIWLVQVALGYKKFSPAGLIVFMMVSGFSGLIGYALIQASKKQSK